MTHLSDKQLQQICSGAYQPPDPMLVHLVECEPCMQRYCSALEQGCLVSPPPSLKEEIIQKSHRSHSWFLLPYVRLAASVAAAVLLWYSGVFSALPRLGLELHQYKQQISASLWHTEQRLQEERLERRSQKDIQAFEEKWTLPFIQNGGI